MHAAHPRGGSARPPARAGSANPNRIFLFRSRPVRPWPIAAFAVIALGRFPGPPPRPPPLGGLLFVLVLFFLFSLFLFCFYLLFSSLLFSSLLLVCCSFSVRLGACSSSHIGGRAAAPSGRSVDAVLPRCGGPALRAVLSIWGAHPPF